MSFPAAPRDLTTRGTWHKSPWASCKRTCSSSGNVARPTRRAAATAEDDRPLAGRRAARLLQAGLALAKLLGHLCDALCMQSWDDEDRDAAALATLGVGGPKLLQALNNAGYLPSYDTGRRRAEGAPRVRPNEPPGVPWLPEVLGHIPGCHVWHLCIDDIHVEDVINVSREALAVGWCATCCRHPMPLASGTHVEALAQRLEQDQHTYHAANQATVVFLAPHTEEGYSAIPVWVIPTCGRFKAEHCRAVRKHMAELCGNAAFRDRHGFLLSADTDGDARRSREMPAALYAEGARTLSSRLRFHTFHSKRMSSVCFATSTTPP